mgnify:CR=1 FL=1
MPANPTPTPIERRFRAYGQELAGLQWPGEGEPVLALHGWPQHHYVYRDLLADPPPGLRIIAPDLPGYGYARAPKVEIEQWTGLIEDYLRGRARLRRVCLLIDARHGLKESDRQVMALLDQAAVVYQAVLTKCDKLKEGALKDRIEGIGDELAAHTAAHPEVMATSARDGSGIPALRAALAGLEKKGEVPPR